MNRTRRLSALLVTVKASKGDTLFLMDGTIVYSATDMAKSAECEFGLLRELDERLGWIAKVESTEDKFLARIADLGNAHEKRELDRLTSEYGVFDAATRRGVYLSVGRPKNRAQYEKARDKTLEVLREGADVVAQATFFDGRLAGFADFLRKQQDGSYAVWDTKLARHVKVNALLQLAAYADQLQQAGIAVAPEVHLLLGDQTQSSHELVDLLPVYRERRDKLQRLLDDHMAGGTAINWGDPAYAACGRCDRCEVEVEAHRDVVLVAGLRLSQRARLHAAGIVTIDDLAASDSAVEGIPGRTLDTLRAQAALQVRQSPPDGSTGEVVAEVYDETAIRALPEPDAGDIFFDFEGDPMWTDDGAHEWGLEYLFGVVEPSEDPKGTFVPFWAHNRAEEKQALLDFLDYVEKRRAIYPDMHIYHYAAYEKSALLRLAGRYGVGEDAVDQLLREGVLVDLYATVRQSVRVSQPSYSIKKLEPLYMGSDLREGVATASESILVYHEYIEAKDAGDAARAADLLHGIADYNEYDCLSTWRLRDWLLGELEASRGDTTYLPRVESDPAASMEENAALVAKFEPHTGELGARIPEQQAIAMVAASIDYHKRENKPYWWEYFDRLQSPPDEWLGKRDALVASDGQVSVEAPWVKEGRKAPYRVLRLAGSLEPGTAIVVGATVECIYEAIPAGMKLYEDALRGVGRSATVISLSVDSDGLDVVVIEEKLAAECAEYDELPMALFAKSFVPAAPLQTALKEFAESLVGGLPTLPKHPALDILRQRPPRTTGGHLAEVVDSDYVAAITDSVRRLDHSYLAVQGPPGTGKTYVAARVVKELVEAGWRIGVVGQSHAVVENVLDAAIEAGLDPDAVAKPARASDLEPHAWQVLDSKAIPDYIAGRGSDGFLLGGTAWTFTNANYVPRAALDLLVIDEAGQFALANTLAVSVSTERLLLLGDPQQLPQVSQGTHPEPVDQSALGWLAGGHQTLPKALGYFLERTWRMHSALCKPVSRLSYESNLRSQTDVTDARALDGVEPGLHVVRLGHRGNSVQSVEEAEVTVELIRSLVGRLWRSNDGTRPLESTDVLVVAPYNAQVALLRSTLASAGFDKTKVGTVDKFQGQEAPVVIVSMTASSRVDVPRGMEFLLSRNRTNVAISRGQWCAYVVRSEALTDYLPGTPTALAELGAFIGLGVG
ncbi:TM0106 family RecB-like putative nuclease [Antricoccus suffuscus]|uniref:TM0106 family RecB-like putative nuclease n=1 Tax=Antricoccus suffuscus TaxID=1629062 RepID=UPI001EDE284D|nr:bifunctional RecB family nuclease/DEAD/DEAH box helicase [Antricoccus suffuscus]